MKIQLNSKAFHSTINDELFEWSSAVKNFLILNNNNDKKILQISMQKGKLEKVFAIEFHIFFSLRKST